MRYHCGSIHEASIKGVTSTITYSHIMEPPTPISFRFRDLPAELVLIIFKYAARPTFPRPGTIAPKNPYSSALSLSQVSKIVRRAVLPELLHTVLLPEARHVGAFIQALRMQKTYVNQNQRDLSFDYASRVHRMWIGECRGRLNDFIDYLTLSAAEPDSESDVSLLSPVILAVPSLAMEFFSLDILLGCLEYACSSSDIDLDVDRNNSPLPWSTKSLTLSGSVVAGWYNFVGYIHGYTFLTTIQHLTLLTSTFYETFRHFEGFCPNDIEPRGPKPCQVPPWITRAPLKKLQTFSMLIPRAELPVVECAPPSTRQPILLDLVTFPASLLPDPWTFQEFMTYIETQEGSFASVSLPVSSSRKLCALCLDRQKMWACGYEGPGELVQVST
ncbi:hypothetical protein BDR04DRAFT_1091380 [Suillus decipiens]|nr:hypothetical protein BDR04DRAFT_1091380 [Suillus decipiens]